MENPIIEIRHVSMMFNMSTQKVDNLKEYLIRLATSRIQFAEFWALRDISLNIERGSALGIIGLNGSGKSTLLKIIAGIMKPSKGHVTVRGSISPLIELGAGFDPDLSARENVYLNGALLGYRRREIQERFDEIIDFADLWEFLDAPLKNFSSGMVARLGFSIATIRKPDIFIADEILGVGDYKFQKKCEKRINQITGSGATVIFVSHSQDQLRRVCGEAVWLNKGHMEARGPVDEILGRYMEAPPGPEVARHV